MYALKNWLDKLFKIMGINAKLIISDDILLMEYNKKIIVLDLEKYDVKEVQDLMELIKIIVGE